MGGTTIRLSRSQRQELDAALGEAPMTAAIIAAMERALSQYIWAKRADARIWVSRFEIPFDQVTKIETELSRLIDKTFAARSDDPLVRGLTEFRAELQEYGAIFVQPSSVRHRPVDTAMVDGACSLVYDLVDCELDITVKTDTAIVEVLDLFRHWADGLAGRERRRRGKTSRYEFTRTIVARYVAANLPHRSDKSPSV